MFWKKIGLSKSKEVPFVSLINKQCNCSTMELEEVNYNAWVLTDQGDRLKLPKYHQNLSILNINYSKYFLIYVALDKCKRVGCNLKIDSILQHKKEVVVKVLPYSSVNQLSLEVVNLPYDVVKVNRAKLDPTQNTKFKFTNHQDEMVEKIKL
ncbi:hypothetical protein JCM16358_20680 [Halanaerocella petrolearia]